jgi:hypothetical protein
VTCCQYSNRHAATTTTNNPIIVNFFMALNDASPCSLPSEQKLKSRRGNLSVRSPLESILGGLQQGWKPVATQTPHAHPG